MQQNADSAVGAVRFKRRMLLRRSFTRREAMQRMIVFGSWRLRYKFGVATRTNGCTSFARKAQNSSRRCPLRSRGCHRSPTAPLSCDAQPAGLRAPASLCEPAGARSARDAIAGGQSSVSRLRRHRKCRSARRPSAEELLAVRARLHQATPGR